MESYRVVFQHFPPTGCGTHLRPLQAPRPHHRFLSDSITSFHHYLTGTSNFCFATHLDTFASFYSLFPSASKHFFCFSFTAQSHWSTFPFKQSLTRCRYSSYSLLEITAPKRLWGPNIRSVQVEHSRVEIVSRTLS